MTTYTFHPLDEPTRANPPVSSSTDLAGVVVRLDFADWVNRYMSAVIVPGPGRPLSGRFGLSEGARNLAAYLSESGDDAPAITAGASRHFVAPQFPSPSEKPVTDDEIEFIFGGDE